MTDTTSSHGARGDRGPETGAASPLVEALRRARWSIFWERLWPVLAGLLTALGLFLTLSWLGLWLWLPPLGRAVGVVAFAALAVAATVPFAYLRLPRKADGLRRLDRGSRIKHRPATTIADELAVTPQDPYSLALWHAHMARTLAVARAFKAGWPSPRIARRDPYALRGLVLIALIATFVAAGGERWKRIAAAFDWQGVVLPANFRVDAWVTPPGYTGKPPIILPGIHPGEPARLADAYRGDAEDAADATTGGGGSGSGDTAGATIAVPAGSILIVRATGALSLDLAATGGVAALKTGAHAPVGIQERRFKIAASGSATLRGAGDDLTWSFTAIPDQPPTIALTKDPQQQARGSILLSYRLKDDYGVTQAEATFVPKDAPAKGAEAPHPLYGPPDFRLDLPQARTRNGVGQTIKDLTDHPWAGTEVLMTLVAHDDGGNVGKSEPFSFRLPERAFTKPLARALVEQRRNLALDTHNRERVITAIDALTLAPEIFTPDAGIYLGLRTIFWSLVRAKTDDNLRDAAARMWQMAVDLEDGDLAGAQAALRNAEEQLRRALEHGAGDDEIKRLMDQLRAAMDRYMQAMAAQMKNNQGLTRPLGSNARSLSSQDVDKMLDRLENLARNGARDAARQLLQQLAQMMENLQMATPDTNDMGMDQMLSELNELGDMIRRQQELRDRTFRQGQDQRHEDAERGEQGRQRQPPGDRFGPLRQGQQALRDRLSKLLEELKNQGFGQNQKGQQGQQGQQGRQGQGQGTDELGRAGQAMGEAEGELGDGNADSAVDAQGRAVEALRKGAQGLADQMQQQLGQGPGAGRNGRLGMPRGQQDTDPLGRPLRGRDYGDDYTVKVPGEIDVQRARRIIEELRRRYGDFARPQEELDYIERLLKDY